MYPNTLAVVIYEAWRQVGFGKCVSWCQQVCPGDVTFMSPSPVTR